jgi:hypothetical protein
MNQMQKQRLTWDLELDQETNEKEHKTDAIGAFWMRQNKQNVLILN